MSEILRGVQVTEALDYLRSLNVVTRAEWDNLTNAQQNAAFSAASIEDKRALEALRNLIAEGLEKGWGSAQFEQKANDLLSTYETEAGSFRTLWNTITAKAMTQGRREMFKDPDVLRAVPYQLYDAFLDAATRANHRALDGAIAPATWDGWGFYEPPNGFNCRCNLISLTRVDGERRLAAGGRYFDITQGVPNQSSPRPGPDPGWTKFAEEREILRFAQNDGVKRPEFTITEAHPETIAMVRDLRVMLWAFVIEQARYFRSIRAGLLAEARSAFGNGHAGIHFSAPRELAVHAYRLAHLLAASRVLGMARVLSEASLEFDSQQRLLRRTLAEVIRLPILTYPPKLAWERMAA